MPTLYPFEGVIQHYAWGGYEYLPELLHETNETQQPWAELWMGAHAKGPGKLLEQPGTLADLIEQQPTDILGPAVAKRFSDRLPFLLKILDVREMLSIQVHPTKSAAEAGFAKEERDGPPRDAPDRNYRDDNHKPELGVAITDFYLLHGFQQPAAIRTTLTELPGWDELLSVFDRGGVRALYAHVMHADQARIDRLLAPLVNSLKGQQYTRDQPRFWAQRAVAQYSAEGHHDRGIFSIFWFNLVHLRPGQGIFQAAGIPHAYLEGVCIELMANSDNVLRGGLTPKHIDVPELLDKTRFDAVTPAILSAAEDAGATNWLRYPTPAPDFELLTTTLKAGDRGEVSTESGAAILLLLSGEVALGDYKLDEDGVRTVFLPAGENFGLHTDTKAELYLATVDE